MMKNYFLIFLFALVPMVSPFAQTLDQILVRTNDFLKTLDESQMHEIMRDFSDTARVKWTNLPVGLAPRTGLKYGDLSESSKIQFHHLLTTMLSSQGYLKTTSILQLDDILNLVYQTSFERKQISEELLVRMKNLQWGLENFYVAIWGKPEEDAVWGFKFEGHHLSLNLSVAGNQYSMTPLFMGTDPAEVMITKYAGFRVLSKEEDYGLQLINALNDQQRSTAILSRDVPSDIITNPNSEQRITEYQGIRANDFNPGQKAILQKLMFEFIGNLEFEKSNEYLQKINTSGMDNIYFAWIGSLERLKPYYYIINGPDFIIEYDNVGFNNDGNHIHSIWREKGNDFGEDILKTHYLKHQH